MIDYRAVIQAHAVKVNALFLAIVLVSLLVFGLEANVRYHATSTSSALNVNYLGLTSQGNPIVARRNGRCLVIEERDLNGKIVRGKTYDLKKLTEGTAEEIIDELTNLHTPDCTSEESIDTPSYALSEDGKLFAVDSGGAITVVEIAPGNPANGHWQVPYAQVTSALQFWGESGLAILTTTGNVILWDFRNESEAPLHSGIPTDQFLVDDRYGVATGTVGGTTEVYIVPQVQGQRILRRDLEIPEPPALAMHAESFIAIGAADGTVGLISFEAKSINTVTLTPPGLRLLAVARSRQVIAGGEFPGAFMLDPSGRSGQILEINQALDELAVAYPTLVFVSGSSLHIGRLGSVTSLNHVGVALAIAILPFLAMLIVSILDARLPVPDTSGKGGQRGTGGDAPSRDEVQRNRPASPTGTRSSSSSKRGFVSYARCDQDAATRLVEELRRAGIEVWFDRDSLLPGQRWESEIEGIIASCDFFVAVLSQSSVAKRGFVQKEIFEALEALQRVPPDQVFLIPVRLDDCKLRHPQLKELHYEDLFPDWSAGVARVIQAIRTRTHAV